MSKLKEEELLEWFKENIDRYAFLQISHPHLAYYPTERDKQAYQQIKERVQDYTEHQELTANYIDIVIDLYDQLEQKKAVTEKFVEKMVEESIYVLHKDMGEFYKRKFKEAGVEVKEKK